MTYCQDLCQCSFSGPHGTQIARSQVLVSSPDGLVPASPGLVPLKPLLNMAVPQPRQILSTNLNRLSRGFLNQKHVSDSGKDFDGYVPRENLLNGSFFVGSYYWREGHKRSGIENAELPKVSLDVRESRGLESSERARLYFDLTFRRTRPSRPSRLMNVISLQIGTKRRLKGVKGSNGKTSICNGTLIDF